MELEREQELERERERELEQELELERGQEQEQERELEQELEQEREQAVCLGLPVATIPRRRACCRLTPRQAQAVRRWAVRWTSQGERVSRGHAL